MTILKSLIFFTIFFLWSSTFFLIFSPVKIFSRSFTQRISKFWSWSVIKLSGCLLNINFNVDGTENLPTNQSFLIVSNHQSAWETFFFSYFFNCPVFILKKELRWIPILSWYFSKLDFIFIDRSKKLESLKHVINSITKIIQANKGPFIIFPEGTRVEPDIKTTSINLGFYAIHKKTGLPILPIVHNSGKFWINKKFEKKGGEISIKILPLIIKLNDRIEAEKKIRKIFNFSF
tara:strand:- start:93 stop:791 length:699 start_codon:yes stop_codon:yes gene_type:complete